MKKKSGKSEETTPQDKKFPLPVYSAEEDIFNKSREIPLKDEEGKPSRKIGADLDVPGAELDDRDEEVGEEDEENNYYSLGGDDHADLDEANEDLADPDA
jgi:hypothetical protein